MTEPMDVYCDSTRIATSPFDLTLYLYKRAAVVPDSTQPPTQVQVGCVRMSLEHAKVLAINLKKQLKMYEDGQAEPIKLHPNAVQQLGISVEEDW